MNFYNSERENELSQRLGTGLSNLLSGGMHGLTQLKLNRLMNEYNYAPGLQSLGYNPEQARGLSNLPEPILKEAIRSQLGGNLNITTGQRLTPAQQRAIDVTNKPFLSRLQARAESARSLKSLAEEMKDLLQQGNVSSGFYGQYAPLWAQSQESQQFAAKSAELQQELASRKSGVASKARLELARQAKANLGQDPKAQLALLNKVIKESDQELLYDEVKDAIIAENEGQQPANIETKVNQRLKELMSQQKLVNKNIQQGLPDPKSVPQGKYAYNDETGELFQNVGGKWVAVGE